MTGEYNAGKSSILSALTGVEIFIDSDIATSDVRSYEWGDVLLVDTPGVKAGRAEHDEIAEIALSEADLVVFVLTVDLFDDVTATHLRHVAMKLGKLDQTVVVINKAASMAADPVKRRAAVDGALGSESPCPIVECDALAALRSQTADPERADRLRKIGNLSVLEDALNDVVRREGPAGRLKQPFQAAMATGETAAGLLVPEPEEAATEKLLNRWRDLLIQSEARLRDNLEHAYHTIQEEVLNVGEQLISAAADGAVPNSAKDEFHRACERIVGDIPGLIGAVFDAELKDVSRQEEALAAGPELRCLADALDLKAPRMPGELTPHNDFASAYVNAMRDLARKNGRAWLEDALQRGSEPGTPMHSLVQKVGHRLEHRFKPHQIVKTSKRVSKAASAGLVLTGVWSEVRQERAEEQAAHEQQAEVRRYVSEWAKELLGYTRSEVNPHTEQFELDLASPANEIERELELVRSRRLRTQDVLEEVRRESEIAVARLKFAPSEGSA